MKRCKVCNKLADNGEKRCQQCGTEFPYDPKKTPYSERKIALIFLLLLLAFLFIKQKMPLPLPDPTTCSRASYRSFKNIVIRTHRDTMFILNENYISSKNLSEIMSFRKDAEAMPVPACLEPAKAAYVDYLKTLYYTAVISAWNGYESATVLAQNAVTQLDLLNAHLDQVKSCLPNCP